MSIATDVAGDLVLRRLVKRFGDMAAVDDVSLTVPQGSFFALLGPSGCGKTTTLRMIAGLEEPTEGAILLGDLDVTHAKAFRRPVNTVFQNYALFPHLDVAANVAFGLKRRKEKDVDRRVQEALGLVQLAHLARRRPSQLSGGQAQRVALARALVNRPRVLLLDEPLGALDLALRRQMQLELKGIQREVGLTFVHVTHDQEEAMTMADTVAVMNRGRIEQMGAPSELYETPATTFVANFLGRSNLVVGRCSGRDGEWVVVDCHGQFVGVRHDRSIADEGTVLVGVRPEKVHLLPATDTATGGNRLTGGIVLDAAFTGVSTEYRVHMPWGENLTVFAQNLGLGRAFHPGDAVTLAWDPGHTFGLSGDAHAGENALDLTPAG